jgi:hypothetical protein
MENIEAVKDKIVGIVKAHYYVSIMIVIVIILVIFLTYKYGSGIGKVSKMLSGRGKSGDDVEDEIDDLIDSIREKQQTNLGKKKRR